jgi:hypothetical protein
MVVEQVRWCSSIGRAVALQAKGYEFESRLLHQNLKLIRSIMINIFSHIDTDFESKYLKYVYLCNVKNQNNCKYYKTENGKSCCYLNKDGNCVNRFCIEEYYNKNNLG